MPHQKGKEMADNFTLTTFITSWKAYQDHLAATVTRLSAEQLALRAAPGLRSVGENVLHIIGCRVHWFTEFLGEDGGAEIQTYERWNEAALRAPYASWDEVGLAIGAPTPTGVELAQGLDYTWRLMTDSLARWGRDGMTQTFPDEEDGKPIEVSRAWVVWHVLEHDLHHGGEISLTLGMHGIDAEFAV